MDKVSTTQGVLFKELSKKPVVVRFDQEHASSDGGSLLLKACDSRLGLTAALAGCLDDRRQSSKVVHSMVELLRQRLFAIACGYADGNDAATLAQDPIFKLLLDRVREAAAAGEAPRPVYGEARYRARSWNRSRRVIIRADVVSHPGRPLKDNPRFLITNIRGWPKTLYERVYCARCDAENRIKELKQGLEIDRTSCTSFYANQLRALMTAAAYVLMQELQLKARQTRCGRAQVSTLRLRLLKIGAWVERSTRHIVLHLPASTVYADDWRRIARSIGAVPT